MSDPADPERALALAYAPAAARPALAALWRLDETLAAIVRSTSEPLIGRMRLTWWHDALAALETAPPPAEPLLQAIAATLPGRAIAPASLAPLIDGWEALLDPLPLEAEAIDAYATGRGETLFALAAEILGNAQFAGARAAGRFWALVDLGFHVSDRTTADAALRAAAAIDGTPSYWPADLRSLGLLCVLARRDLAAGLDRPRRIGSPARVARALVHRVTGR